MKPQTQNKIQGSRTIAAASCLDHPAGTLVLHFFEVQEVQKKSFFHLCSTFQKNSQNYPDIPVRIILRNKSSQRIRSDTPLRSRVHSTRTRWVPRRTDRPLLRRQRQQQRQVHQQQLVHRRRRARQQQHVQQHRRPRYNHNRRRRTNRRNTCTLSSAPLSTATG